MNTEDKLEDMLVERKVQEIMGLPDNAIREIYRLKELNGKYVCE